ncbi:hypothetical protein RUND412_000201 [Rhizina undulata]
MRAPSPQTYSSRQQQYSYPSALPPAPYPITTSSAYTSNNFYPLFPHSYPLSPAFTAAEKRLKLQRDSDNGFVEDLVPSVAFASPNYPVCMSHFAYNPAPRAPYLSFHHTSEPASPDTVATPISTHSTPSSSPSRATVMSDTPPDFQLFDDSFLPTGSQNQQRQHSFIRGCEAAPPFGNNTSNPSSATNTQFTNTHPVVIPQSSSSYSQAGLPYYPSTFTPDHHNHHHHQQHYLQTPTPYRNQALGLARSSHSDDEDVPGLSRYSTSSRPSISEPDLPATPVASPDSHDDGPCGPMPTLQIHTPVPKLNRTISDAVQDELFNPGIAPGTSHTPQKRSPDVGGLTSTFPTLFQQAQNQHTMARSASTNPTFNRDHSPFRANSPFYNARHQIVTPSPSRSSASLLPVYTTARAQREREARIEADNLIHQMEEEHKQGTRSPKTISPKDAYLDYHEPEDEDVKGSLFEDTYSTSGDAISNEGSYKGSIHGDDEDVKTEQSFGLKTEESFGSMATSRRASSVNLNFAAPMFPDNGSQQFSHIPYPHYFQRPSEEPSGPASLSSNVEGDNDYEYTTATSPSQPKPVESNANSGAYTCTVPGCTQRFPTVQKMSKHRKEAHRQTTPLNRDGMTGLRAHHAGPHRCTRINPTTNKPCNTVFSRPYDLTRHEDTIHNTAREKVRCEICNDEKTFSRQDALTRHKKVKHGIDK